MIGFREFLEEREHLDEAIIRKGAVALYAAQGKRHGDEAVRSYQAARQILSFTMDPSGDEKVDHLAKAMIALADGLISSRKQLGAISAQVTASNI
jgi:hypothetical protein